MKDGYIKVMSATTKTVVADCVENTKSIIEAMDRANDNGAKLLVTGELSITGYTCEDLFFQKKLIDAALEGLKVIVDKSKSVNCITIVGAPLIRNNSLYNCAVVVYKGEILGVVPKKFIPNYNEFYEYRTFAAAPDINGTINIFDVDYPFGSKIIFKCQQLPEFSFGIEICEDLWTPVQPSFSHVLNGASIIANLSASNETVGKSDYRRNLVKMQSARLHCAYIYASQGVGESTTDLVFSGHNIIAENGILLAENKVFTGDDVITEIDVQSLFSERIKTTTYNTVDEDYIHIEFDMNVEETSITRYVSRFPFVPDDDISRRCDEILAIQAEGLAKRVSHTHAKKLVIGISGGLDSALALIVAARAIDKLGRDRRDVLAISMPCFGTTSRTKNNAQMICDALGVSFEEIIIKDAVKQHFKDIGQSENEYDVTYENSQARERTQVLMDVANKCGGLVIGTGDLSELALGWATYNGDHMSMYAVNASVPKTIIRHIIRYVAESSEISKLNKVLNDILDTPVSPELLPSIGDDISQCTEELVGPYELHDFFLYYIVGFGFSPAKIYRLAKYAFDDYNEETIKKWLVNFYRRFFSQQFKRSCLPDGPKIGAVSLSPRGDWRMPSDASASLWIREAEKL